MYKKNNIVNEGTVRKTGLIRDWFTNIKKKTNFFNVLFFRHLTCFSRTFYLPRNCKGVFQLPFLKKKGRLNFKNGGGWCERVLIIETSVIWIDQFRGDGFHHHQRWGFEQIWIEFQRWRDLWFQRIDRTFHQRDGFHCILQRSFQF